MGKELLLAGRVAPAGGVLRVAQGTSFFPNTGSVGGSNSSAAGAVTGAVAGTRGLLLGIGRACVAVDMASGGGRSSGDGIPENAATVGAVALCESDAAGVPNPVKAGLPVSGASAASVVSLSDE